MNSLFEKLINSQRVSQAEKFAFLGKRTYLLTINVEVRVKSKCPTLEIWFPLPLKTDYQSLLKIEFSKPVPEILEEEVFGNEVARWRIENPSVGRYFNFNETCEVVVHPRKTPRIEGDLAGYDKGDPQYKLYTKDDPFFNFSDPRIEALAKKLVGGQATVRTVAKKFYDYVLDKLNYGNPIEGLYSSIDALEKDVVDCGGFDCLLGALLRSVGIPARLVSGILAGYPGEHMHAWLEFMTPEGLWVPTDPSNEKLRLEKRDFKPGGFGKVGNDRIAFSIGTNIKISEKNFPLIQLPAVEGASTGRLSVSRKIETKILRE